MIRKNMKVIYTGINTNILTDKRWNNQILTVMQNNHGHITVCNDNYCINIDGQNIPAPELSIIAGLSEKELKPLKEFRS